MCCANGTSFVADFPAPSTTAVTNFISHEAAPVLEMGFLSEDNGEENRVQDEGSCASDTGAASSEALLGGGKPHAVVATDGGLDSTDDERRALNVGGDGISTNKQIIESSDKSLGESVPAVKVLAAEKPRTGSASAAKLRKIWDPVIQMELFQATVGTAASLAVDATPSTCGSETHIRFDPDSDSARVRKTCESGKDEVPDPTGGRGPGQVAFAGGAGGVESRIAGGNGGSKAPTKMPVQAGRVAWCEDGRTLFLLTHEGGLGVSFCLIRNFYISACCSNGVGGEHNPLAITM